MPSTPDNSSTDPKTPPKTAGWGLGLFGSSWLSGKKTSRVYSSTNSTGSKSQQIGTSTRVFPSPRPFQNLEGFNNVQSPDQVTFATPTTGSVDNPSARVTTNQQQSHQQRAATPYVSGRQTQTTSDMPSTESSATASAASTKSPWKGSHAAIAKGIQFSVGDLHARNNTTRSNRRGSYGRPGNFSMSTTTRIAPVAQPQRRRGFNPSRLLTINRRRNNRSTDKAEINRLLSNARASFVASNQKIEADNNFRTTISRIRPGRRLLPVGQQGVTGRLAQQPASGAADNLFVTNGKRAMERDGDGDDDESGTEGASRKKRRVNFGSEEKNLTTPIESLVVRATKRKATPYKKASVVKFGNNEGDTEDGNGDDEDMPPPSSNSSKRELLKVKRPNSSKKSSEDVPKSAEDFPIMPKSSEDFPIMPDKNQIVGGDYSTWSTAAEPKYSGSPAMAHTGIVSAYWAGAVGPPTSGITSSIPTPFPPPQFKQEPLFVGKKKDRTCHYEEEEYSEQETKRVNLGKWKCPSCGYKNNSDESACQNMIFDVKLNKDRKCSVRRATEVSSEGWGNLFSGYAHLNNPETMIKCHNCGVSNPKDRDTCMACEAKLGGESSSNKNDTTTNKPEPISKKGTSFGGAAGATTSTGGATSSTGFMFGAPASSVASSKTTTGGFKFAAVPTQSTTSTTTNTGGFQFGAAPAPGPSASSATPTTKAGGFKFSSTPAPTPSTSSAATKTGGFQFGSMPAPAPVSASSSPPTGVTSKVAFTFGSSSAKAPADSSSKPDSGAISTTAPKFSFGASKNITRIPEQESPKIPVKEPIQKRKKDGETSATQGSDNQQSAPGFSFGNSSAVSSTTVPATTSGFSFGNTSVPASVAPTTPAATGFSFGSNTSAPVLPLGSVATEGNDDASSKKKRRSVDGSTATSSSQPAFSFGSNTGSEAPAAPIPLNNSTPAPAPSAPVPAFTFGKVSTDSSSQVNSSTTAPASISAPSFGSAPAPPPSFGSTQAPPPSFGSAPAPTPSFGSTPAPTPSFGSTPAPTPSFGSTPAPPPSFGSTPAPPPSFGSTPAPTPSFGSTPAPAAPFSFGSTPATAPAAPAFGSNAPAPVLFGSTPAPAPSSGFGSAQAPATFGSTPAAAPAPFGTPAPMGFGSSAPAPFGSTPAAPTQSFGNNATTFGSPQPLAGAPTPMAFGGTPAPTQNATPGGFGSGFGQHAPQQQDGGFSLGSSGAAPRGSARGRRRVVRARRPR
uniref:RanBP2-type domain-containing protein n=1 Tax=Pseudo-nitzschia australis TaxID=44445 RepID=A0A7S4AII5_9STRA